MRGGPGYGYYDYGPGYYGAGYYGGPYAYDAPYRWGGSYATTYYTAPVCRIVRPPTPITAAPIRSCGTAGTITTGETCRPFEAP
jgi:hypothetical protein